MTNFKVIYIAGTGRCGSTILDMILGQLPGATSVGELRYLWKRGIGENRLCATGEPFLQNPNWKRIVDNLYGSKFKEKAFEYATLESRLRIREMLGLKTSKKSRKLQERVSPYALELGRVFSAIRDEFDTDLIIDSSKMPMHGYALAQIPEIDLRIVHLVRDRKAVVHSWNTTKFDQGKNGMMNTQSVRKASIEWELINRWIERYLGDGSLPYLKISYTGFTCNPVQSIDELIQFIGESKSVNPVNDSKDLNILSTSSISGNPARFSDGRLTINEDVRWRNDMPVSKRIMSDFYGLTTKSLFFL